MKKLLALAAAGEAVLGLVLLVYPSVVIRLLFGAEIEGAVTVMSRVSGIALIALGAACSSGSVMRSAFWGMLTYSMLVMVYLAYLGVEGVWVGRLLWPAASLHAVLTFLLVRAGRKERQSAGRCDTSGMGGAER